MAHKSRNEQYWRAENERRTSIRHKGKDGQIRPLRVELTRLPQHRELREEYYGCNVRFKAGRNAIVFEEWLDKPNSGKKIAETNSKTQFDPMNNRSNGKSRMKCLFYALIFEMACFFSAAGQTLYSLPGDTKEK